MGENGLFTRLDRAKLSILADLAKLTEKCSKNCGLLPQCRHLHCSPILITAALSLTGSASRTDLSQLANGIWGNHAGCPSFLRVSSVAKIGYIPQFKAPNARDQDEVSRV